MEKFIVFDSGYDGLGNLVGCYSKVQYAVEAAKIYLGTPILFIEGKLLTYAQVTKRLKKVDQTALISPSSESLSGCTIFKVEEDKNNFIAQ